jgi:hypothetical protein
MKTLALAVAVLVAGCATTNSPPAETDARLIKLQNKSQEISERKRHCIHETVIRSNDQIARIAATLDALTGLRTQRAKDDRDRELSECKANADREKDELSARERAEYEGQAQDERERNALMMILTTSRPR